MAHKTHLNTQINTLCLSLRKAFNFNFYSLNFHFELLSILDLGYFNWEEPGILRNIVYFIGVGFGAFVILFLMEFRIFEVIYYYVRMVQRAIFGILCKTCLRRPPIPEDSAQCDIDVKYEKERINSMMPADFANYNLVMKNMSRYYKDFLAVNQLCIGIKHSECFGLLG